jgi:hypothetical protein
MLKKIFSFLLSLALVTVTFAPSFSQAADDPKPDLVIKNMYATDLSGTSLSADSDAGQSLLPAIGKDFYIALYIGNDGDAPTTKGYHVRAYYDDKFFDEVFIDNVLYPQEAFTVYAQNKLKPFKLNDAAVGNHTIEITIDSRNEIDESNEDNNTYTKTIAINADTDSAAPSDDIVSGDSDTSTPPALDDNKSAVTTQNTNETLTLYFNRNNLGYPAKTRLTYTGTVTMTVNGTGKDSGTSDSDAYYIFTNYEGQPVAPLTAREFGLYVDGQRLADIYPQGYQTSHEYTFNLNVGSDPRAIKFAIGDGYTADNSGYFTIKVSGTVAGTAESESSAAVPAAGDNAAATESTTPATENISSLVLKLQNTISSLESKVTELEKKLVTKVDEVLTERLKGRILLQVENNGEAWYVDPTSENKLYLQNGQTAYDIMRSLGLGITNKDLESIPIGVQENIYTLQDSDVDGIPDNLEVAIGTDPNNADTDGDGRDDKTEILAGYKPTGTEEFSYNKALIGRLEGRIVLQVESHGEAWYINPSDSKRYYLGDGDTAYNVMRFLSLGITNDNLRKIQVGEFSQ